MTQVLPYTGLWNQIEVSTKTLTDLETAEDLIFVLFYFYLYNLIRLLQLLGRKTEIKLDQIAVISNM